jgi:hypothetical protein
VRGGVNPVGAEQLDDGIGGQVARPGDHVLVELAERHALANAQVQ